MKAHIVPFLITVAAVLVGVKLAQKVTIPGIG